MMITALTLSLGAAAQETTETKGTSDTTRKKTGKTISISSDGITVTSFPDSIKKKEDKDFKFRFAILELGINYLQDNTDYSSAAAQDFLNVDPEMRNENLFSLREGKSINVNIYPVMGSYRFVNTRRQKMYISSGIGLQIYNFRFNKPISYINETRPMVVTDTVSFSKNKLAVTYLSIPLSVTCKTKLAKDTWLVYGVGITGGYRLSSWTKQVSDERGKQKNRDPFNLNNFNSCVTGELGIDGVIRLYASYQLTALHKDALDQHPYAIGIRFGGI